MIRSVASLFLLMGLFVGISTFAAVPEVSVGNAKLSPESIFAKETTAITVTAEFTPPPGQPAPPIALIETDEKGNKLRYIGVLTDDGIMGDMRAHDGIYSRKFQFSENKRKLAYFAIVQDQPPGSPGSGKLLAPPILLQVIYRPSFVEMVSEAWQKIRNGFSKS